MRMFFILIIPVLLAAAPALAQQEEKTIQQGNEYYRQQQFDKAESAYQKALQENPASEKAKFNLANSLQKQGKQEEALKGFAELADNTKEKEQKARAFYNKGVVLTRQKKLEESIEAYKNALRRDPSDKEARENLQKALLELKKKNPPKKEEKKEPKKQQPKKQQQPKMSPKEAEQRLKLLQQKEKEVNQRLQKEKSKSGGSQAKDW
ncbi:MAG: tetratricopeptide repeat protein [Sphingobacteriales bacterium]|nr:tetratricopeptide repeat protein [Sphingobacteriales bacterium]